MAVYKTIQRKTLLDYLKAHCGQTLTVRDIVSGIAKEHTDNAPSESTVYRLMRELVEDGTVKKDVNVESRENVYCFSDGENRGVSMRCRVCGNVYSVDDESSRRIKDELSRCGEAVPEENIEFIIKCRKCGK
ncbi:MAG: transcriptional repressor [Ruminiclostridium sp.]|nr:transcriptional repressor [Ruminiclostridium sp.]